MSGRRRPIRVGLIGVGKHGKRYAAHIRRDLADELHLVALARRSAAEAEVLAREFDCRAYTDYRKLIDEADVDAIIVVVPPSLHLDVVSAAARAGRALLLEKPVATSLAMGRKLQEVLALRPVPVMAAQTLRYNAVIQALLGELPSIGPVHSVALTQRFEASRLDWIDDPGQAGGGITLLTGVHSFDLLRLLTGVEAEEVSCQVGAVHTRRTEDNFAASVRMEGGAILGVVSGSRAAGGRTGYIEVAGEGGTLVGDHVGHWLRRVVGPTGTLLSVGKPVPTVREVLREFARALADGRPLAITLEDGLRAVAIAEACHAAARSGRTVTVEAIA